MVWRSMSAYGGWAITIGLGGAMIASGFTPPLAGFSASAWVYDQQHVSAEVGAWDFKGCRYVKGSAEGYAGEGDSWWRVDVNVGPHGPPLDKLGWRDLGRWTWGRPEGFTNVKSVMATLTVVCGKEQPTKIDVGPFDAHG